MLFTSVTEAAGLADECLLQLGYCIGQADPVSVMVNAHGTGSLADGAVVFPLSPRGMIDHPRLQRPVYRETAAYGHFGRPGFWENLDATEALLDAAGENRRCGVATSAPRHQRPRARRATTWRTAGQLRPVGPAGIP